MSNEHDKSRPDDPQEHIETSVLDTSTESAAESPADDADTEVAALSAELEAARAEAAANLDKYMRIVAELDNVRKRSAREIEKARNFGVEGLAGALLDVADSLEMALATGSAAPAESLLEGGRATLKQLKAAMEKYGVTEVFPEGEPFDPALHEAMTTQPSETAEPDTVVTVIQRGYCLNGRLLRPARVVVACRPEAPEPE